MDPHPERRPDIASVAALFADPTRARIVSALLDGRALPATVLADESGVSASTTSEHLAKLVNGGVLAVERSGRHRYYRLTTAEVADAIEALAVISPQPAVTSLRESTRAAAMRQARTCYDHLAGRYGVAVTAALVERGVLVRTDGADGTRRSSVDRLAAPARSQPCELGTDAAAVLHELGVDLEPLLARPRSARPLLRFCVDWSEQQYHLAGALGAAVLGRAVQAGLLAPRPGGRTVRVTDEGAVALRDLLGVDVQDVVAAAS